MEDQICSVTTLTGFTYDRVCNVRRKKAAYSFKMTQNHELYSRYFENQYLPALLQIYVLSITSHIYHKYLPQAFIMKRVRLIL